MRRFILEQGICTPSRSQIHTASPIRALKRPSQALRRLQRVVAGQQLHVSISRSSGGIGDVLMTLPTVRAIKKTYDCSIDYVTDFDYLGGALPKVLEGNPYIDRVMDYRELTQDDREEYDAFVDLTCPCTPHEQPGAPSVGRIELFARHAGVRLDDHTIDYFITKEELEWASEFINSKQIGRNQLFMVQAHSSSSRRDLPISKLQAVMAGILAGKKDARAIVVTHGSDNAKHNWHQWGVLEAKDLGVRQVAALMHYCELVICQDSAILHLAGALHRRSLSFFGPTDPGARIDYFPEAVSVWGAATLSCRNCWWSSSCRTSIPTCWQLIDIDLATKTALAMLNNSPILDCPELVHFGSFQKAKLSEIL